MRPEHIIVTSNYSIDQCFDNQEDVEAFNRRFIIVYGRPQCDIYSLMLGDDSNTRSNPPRASEVAEDTELNYI